MANSKSKKKTVTQDASPETSSSRRSTRETSSSKQTKEIPSSTRKSKRLENIKSPDSPPIQRKSTRNQEQITTTPLKRYGRRNKHTSVGSSGTKKVVEDPVSSSAKSKNEKVKRRLKIDSKEDQKQEKQGSNVGGRKRKRVTSSVYKASFKSQRKRTEADNDNEKESQGDSSQATSSNDRDVENSKNTNSGSDSMKDKGDDDVEECSDNTGEESSLKASETQCSTSSSSLTNFNVEEISDDVVEEESPNSKKVEEEEEESPNSKKDEDIPVPNDVVKELPNDIDKTVDLKQVEHVDSPSSSKSDTTTKKTEPDVCTDVKEYWVPVQISNVQLEQYCSMLLTNAMALSSCSKSDTVGALHDILVSNRKCCDHPYIVDQSLQAALTKDLEPVNFLEVGIKASGKLQFLDLILPELRKRELRVLILFQPLSGTGKDSTSIGDILDDFTRQRFGIDSYERVDAVITTPSKRQTALNNFNNKQMNRFIFLLDSRACQPSIKLSSLDTIIIFDSDWNPSNDLKALQKISINSNPKELKIFRLYTSFTLEEKILKLSEGNATIDKGLQNLSRSTCDELLMFGASYLFSKLTEFHCANILPEEWEGSDLKEEFLNLVCDKCFTDKLNIIRCKQSCENFSPVVNELPGGEQPHTFWRKLLAGRDPCWKYLTQSTPRQRKRPQFYEESLIVKTNVSSDDVGRKRKKTVVVTEKGEEVKEVCNTGGSSEGSQLSPGENISCAATCNERTFRYLLKLNIAELCRVLKLPEEVRKMVEKFLDYVIENYQVNKEPANTLQAFLISLCWIGCGLLKKKLDRKQTLLIAKKRLNFTCEEEETNSVFLKLESAKDMFLLDTQNQKKTNLLKEVDPHVVKVEIPDSPQDDNYVTISPDTSDVPEDPNNTSLPVPASQEISPPPIQPLVSPPVPTNPVQDKDAEKVDKLITETPPPQVLETTTTADGPNQSAANLWANLFNLYESENYNRGPPRMPTGTDPLQVELEKLSELKNTVNNFYEAIKVKIKGDYEKERAEMLARLNRKYEDKSQKAELAFQLKKKEIDMSFNKVVVNKILADAFKSKCRDLNPFENSQIQRELQHFHQFHGQPSSSPSHPSSSPGQPSFSPGQPSSAPGQPCYAHGQPSFAPGQPSSSPGQPSSAHGQPSFAAGQSSRVHQTLEFVHQSANLFSNTATSSRPYNNHPITPSPPSNLTTTTATPTTTTPKPAPTIGSISRPPPHMSKPPPNITSTTPSVRNPRLTTEIRAPAPHIRPFKPSTDHASHKVILNHLGSSRLPPTFSHTPPPSQTPTNHNSQPVAPPPSTQLPSEQQPPPPATSSTSLPSVSVTDTGLYSSASNITRPDVMSVSAMDLLKDVDEQAGFYQTTNVLPSPPQPTTVSVGANKDGELVCLSDDD